MPFCPSSCVFLLDAWWVSLPDKIPGYLGHRHQVIAAALPLQNVSLSFEKGIKDSTGSFNKWFLLLLQEHQEALGYAVLQAAHSTTETSLATAAPVPVAQTCTEPGAASTASRQRLQPCEHLEPHLCESLG